jgi:hypothetical protein
LGIRFIISASAISWSWFCFSWCGIILVLILLTEFCLHQLRRYMGILLSILKLRTIGAMLTLLVCAFISFQLVYWALCFFHSLTKNSILSITGVRSCYDEGKRVAETLMFDYHRQHGIGNCWSSVHINFLSFSVRYMPCRSFVL